MYEPALATLTAFPPTVFSVIVCPGPTFSASFAPRGADGVAAGGVGVGVGGVPTVNAPRIEVACGSQTNR